MKAPPFRSIYFDCDSTLSTLEGVDELGRFQTDEVAAQLRALTAEAMDGTSPLAEVYEKRLALLKPTRQQLDSIGTLYIKNLVPDVAMLIEALQSLGKTVGIISGGLLTPVQTLAEHLKIPAERVHAVGIEFDADGHYIDFDRACPLWKNGGKLEVLAEVPEAHRPLCFVGDGVTDLEAGDLADRFIGFGGVARREAVEAAAKFYFASESIAPLLQFVLSPSETETLRATPFRRLLEKTP